MEKLDLTKQYKQYYTAAEKPALVIIDKAVFLSIAGKGDPSGQAYSERIQALYSLAYTVKFHKKAQEKDFVVAKLEAQWWFDSQSYADVSISEAPLKIPRDAWEYRLLIRMPEFVTAETLATAKEILAKKKQTGFAEDVVFWQMEEGKCVQMLHTGPFDKEPESLLQIQKFITENNLIKNGLHHEIYLSDFNKTAPEKLRTILREPVK